MVKIMITKIILASKTICNYGRAKFLKTYRLLPLILQARTSARW